MSASGLPTISFLLPVRNEENHLSGCLEAILAQDYPAERMEVLVVDGRSTDGTLAIAGEYAGRDSRIQVLDNPDRSAPAGLNIGVRAAHGDYLLRVDGHTVIDPDYARTCVDYLQTTGVGCVGGLMRAVGDGYWGRVIATVHGSRFGLGGGRFHGSDRDEEVDTVYLGAWPRAVFDRVGLFNETLVRNQDIEFNYRVRAAGLSVFLSPRIRSFYYVRPSLGSFLKQNFRNGFWNVALLHKAPKALSLRHLVPLAFISAIFLGIALSPWTAGRLLLASVLTPYLALALLSSTTLAHRHGWNRLPALLLAFPALHLAYGLGYLAGFARFGVPWALLSPAVLGGLIKRKQPSTASPPTRR